MKTKCRKESTWEEGGRQRLMKGKFLVLTTFSFHFTLCLIFIRVWPVEDFLFEIRQIDKLRNYMINLNIYINIIEEMSITHMQSLPGYHQNGFVATQAIGHMMYLMYSELFNCIQRHIGKFLLCICWGYFRNRRQHPAIIQC